MTPAMRRSSAFSRMMSRGENALAVRGGPETLRRPPGASQVALHPFDQCDLARTVEFLGDLRSP